MEELATSEGYAVRRVAVERDGDEIGTIELIATRAGLREEITTNTIAIVLVTLAVLATITTASLVISRCYIVKPLADLQMSAAAIGGGDLDTDIRMDGQDEIAQLARSFSSMRNSTRDLVAELRQANETLEVRVDQRTKEVAATQQKLVDAIESTSEGFRFLTATTAGPAQCPIQDLAIRRNRNGNRTRHDLRGDIAFRHRQGGDRGRR